MGKCGFDDIDKALLERFKVQWDTGFPVSGPVVKNQAENFCSAIRTGLQLQ
jgi:hypothetical protein